MSKANAIKLSMLGLPVMETINDFSRLTHISIYTIYKLSTFSDKYYLTFEIPKKNGKVRTISQPSKKLKGLQSWILFNILNKLNVSSSCKGFEKKTSIRDNAEPHRDSSVIVTLDLMDFFTNIKAEKVFNIFNAIGYNKLISTILTKLCTYNDSLPQGGPCSPKLANLSTWTLDVRIQGFVGKRGITYTRYADDLTFSGHNPQKVVQIIAFISYIIEQEKLKLNERKTRVAGLGCSKKVTGLIISDNKIGIGQKKYRELRSKIHYLTKPAEQSNYKRVNEIQGWLSYLNSVDKHRYENAIKFIRQLKERYPTSLIDKIFTPPIAISVKTEVIVVN